MAQQASPLGTAVHVEALEEMTERLLQDQHGNVLVDPWHVRGQVHHAHTTCVEPSAAPVFPRCALRLTPCARHPTYVSLCRILLAFSALSRAGEQGLSGAEPLYGCMKD